MNNLTERRRALMSSLNKSRLPEGYQEVAWLKGSGTQWCQTDFYPCSYPPTIIEIYGDLTLENTSSKFAFGNTWSDGASYTYGLNINGTLFTYYYGESAEEYTSVRLNNTERPFNVHFELKYNAIILNEIERSRPVTVFEQSPNPFRIGTFANGNIFSSNVRIKTLTIYSKPDKKILTELIPCYRISDNKAGFYQTLIPSGGTHFLTNRASGSDWIIGPVV